MGTVKQIQNWENKMGWFHHRDSKKSKRRGMLRFCCAFCWSKLEGPSELAGQMHDCPHCGNSTFVPTDHIWVIADFFKEFYERMYVEIRKLFATNGIPLGQTAELELGAYLLFDLLVRLQAISNGRNLSPAILFSCISDG